jgi:hypothetical protein
MTSIYKLLLILFFFNLTLIGCVKSSKFDTPSCAKGNANCEAPAMTIGVVGGDEDQEDIPVGNNNDAISAIKIKTVRYGERAVIEFKVKNPKFAPLKYIGIEINPGDSAFTVGDAVTVDTCGEGLLYFSQTCGVGISYSPSTTPPTTQNIKFNFETITGSEFDFTTSFLPAQLLQDFSLDVAQLEFPTELAYAVANPSSYEREITVSNWGTEIDLTNIAFSITGDSSFTLGTPPSNACAQGATLAKRGGTCKILIKFKPTSSGTKSAQLNFTSSDGTSRSYSLNGSGAELETANGASDIFDFGVKIEGGAATAKSTTFTVPSNEGSVSASSCTYNKTGSAQFSITQNNCSATQTAGSNCQIEVTWTPQNAVALDQGTLTISCDSRGGETVYSLAARTVENPLVTNKISQAFEDTLVGSSSTKTIQFSNLGTLGLLTAFTRSITAVSGNAFTIDSETCSATIASSATCDAVIKFIPSSFTNYSSELGATSQQATMDYTVPLTGSGISVLANLSLVDMGFVVVGRDRPGATITISNPSTFESATGCAFDAGTMTAHGFSIDSDSTCLSKTSLSAGETCTLKPRLTGSLPEGSREKVIGFACTVGGRVDITLRGQVSNETRLVILAPTSKSYSDRLVGISEEFEFQLANQHATETATSLLLNTSVSSAAWSRIAATTDDCSGFTQLTPGQSCFTRFRFAPSLSQAGTHTGSLEVSAASGEINPADPTFSGVAEKITASTSSHTLNNAFLNEDTLSPTSLIFTNPSGIDTASGCSLAFAGSDPYTIEATTCGATILPSSTCSAQVKLPAQASIGTYTGTLTMSCSIGGTATINLTAEVTDPPALTWTGSPTFGNLDLDAAAINRTFTLTNNKSFAVTLTDFSSSFSDASFSISSTNCVDGMTLAPAAACTVDIQFDPSTVGEKAATLSALATKNGSSTTYTSSINLSGTAHSMDLVLSSSTLNLDPSEVGEAGIASSGTITVTNNGTRTASLAVALSSANNSYIALGSGGSCGATLAVAASCTLEFENTASPSASSHTETYVISDSIAGSSSNKSLTLNAQTIAAASFGIKDDRAQSTYTATIATADITGAVDNANNIADLTPASRDITFTLSNTVATSSDIESLIVSFAYASGTNSRMTKQSDDCNGSTLSGSDTCTIIIRYTPTTSAESSTYTLSVTGTNATTGATHTVAATAIIGNSIKAPLLNLSSTAVTMGPVDVATTSNSVTLTNNGDQTATSLNLALSGSDSSYFGIASPGIDNTCGSSLAGGASCTFKMSFDPSSKGVLAAATLTASESKVSSTDTLTVGGAGQKETSTIASTNSYGKEADIQFDGNKYYIIAKNTDATTYSNPVLTVCDAQSSGGIDTAQCTSNVLNNGSNNLLAGTYSGSGPRLAFTDNLVLIILQNNDAGLGGSAGNGNASILACRKPSSGRTVSYSTDCTRFDMHSVSALGSAISGAGLFGNIKVANNKVVIANQYTTAGATDGYIIVACNVNMSTTTPSSAIDLSSCKNHQNFALNFDTAMYPSLDFNGTQLVMTGQYNSAGVYSLNATACTVAANNDLTCSASFGAIATTTEDYSGNTIYPGAYSSVSLQNNKLYVAHQQGTNYSRYLKLTTCNVSNTTISSCSSATLSSSTATDGTGLAPKAYFVSNGTTQTLYISFVKAMSHSASQMAPKVNLTKCDISTASPTCDSSSYFAQGTSRANVQLYSRGITYNSNKKVLTLTHEGATNSIGTISIGLTSEL